MLHQEMRLQSMWKICQSRCQRSRYSSRGPHLSNKWPQESQIRTRGTPRISHRSWHLAWSRTLTLAQLSSLHLRDMMRKWFSLLNPWRPWIITFISASWLETLPKRVVDSGFRYLLPTKACMEAQAVQAFWALTFTLISQVWPHLRIN